MSKRKSSNKGECTFGILDGNWALNPRGSGSRRSRGGDPSSFPRSNSSNSLLRTEPLDTTGRVGRKNSPQKSKSLDKKPRARGGGFGGPVKVYSYILIWLNFI